MIEKTMNSNLKKLNNIYHNCLIANDYKSLTNKMIDYFNYMSDELPTNYNAMIEIFEIIDFDIDVPKRYEEELRRGASNNIFLIWFSLLCFCDFNSESFVFDESKNNFVYIFCMENNTDTEIFKKYLIKFHEHFVRNIDGIYKEVVQY